MTDDDLLKEAERIYHQAEEFRKEGRRELIIPQPIFDELASRFVLVGEFEKQLPKLIAEIKRLRAETTRLEAAYLQLYRDSISGSGPDKEAIKGKMARESLERIKAGESEPAIEAER